MFFPTHFTQHFLHINSTYAKCDEGIVYLSFLINTTFFPPIFIISFHLLFQYAIQKQRAENEQISNFLRAIIIVGAFFVWVYSTLTHSTVGCISLKDTQQGYAFIGNLFDNDDNGSGEIVCVVSRTNTSHWNSTICERSPCWNMANISFYMHATCSFYPIPNIKLHWLLLRRNKIVFFSKDWTWI